jgi:acyl-CoA synthetase (AMP-forming)/AMP-acid ligase II
VISSALNITSLLINTQILVGDWMLTGDLGEMDAEGSIRFISRDDDDITSGGYRIGPGEVEDCLLGHPAVRLAAVIGYSTKRGFPGPFLYYPSRRQPPATLAAFVVFAKAWRKS